MALKSVQRLVSAAKQGATAASYGNHSFDKHNSVFYFRYHGHPVCIYDQDNDIISYSSCGYEGSPSTTRTIRSYQELFTHATVIEREQHNAVINNRGDINNGR